MAADNSGKSKFLAAFNKSDKLKKALGALKNARNPNERPDIPEGNYVAVVRGGAFSEKEGIPRVSLNLQVSRGPKGIAGTPLQKRYDFGVVSDKVTMTEEQIFERIGQDLIQMGQTLKNDTPAALVAAFEKLFEEKPEIKIAIKFGRSGFMNIYVNGLAEQKEKPEDDEEEDDSNAEAESDGEEDEADDDGDEDASDDEADDEEDDSDDDQPIQVKDRVLYKPKGAKQPDTFSVTASDPAKRVCSLRHAKTNVVHKGVSWDDVALAQVD